MTALLSIRLDKNLLNTLKEHAHILHLTKTEYVRQAIIKMNKMVEEQERIQRIQSASLRVRAESMKVNAEFEAIEDDPTL